MFPVILGLLFPILNLTLQLFYSCQRSRKFPFKDLHNDRTAVVPEQAPAALKWDTLLNRSFKSENRGSQARETWAG
jgi:hypothetical protein